MSAENRVFTVLYVISLLESPWEAVGLSLSSGL